MIDLYVGLAWLLVVSLGLFGVAVRFPRAGGRRQGLLLMLGTLVATALFAVFLRDNILLARCLPFSNVIVLGNWFPIAAAILAGLAWRYTPGGRLRRCCSLAGLALVGTYAALQPLLGQPPRCGNRWDVQGICRQTTPYSCAPACAATVLKMHGIAATEQELAELCLTRKGTTWQGLYRGLKLKTAGTPYDVEVFSCSADSLRPLTPDCMILTVGLRRGAKVDPIYEQQYSWTRGTLHAVLLFDFVPNERVEMADPDVGKEQWTGDDLRVLFRGRGMRLVRRAGVATAADDAHRRS